MRAGEIVEEQGLADSALKAEIRKEMVRSIRHRVFEADRVSDGVEPTHGTTTRSGIAAVAAVGGSRPLHRSTCRCMISSKRFVQPGPSKETRLDRASAIRTSSGGWKPLTGSAARVSSRSRQTKAM